MTRNLHQSSGYKQAVQVGCGQCMDCRLERTRQWAVRITHEASLHASNYFITLTYKDAPRSLDHEHFQLFFKRLRKKFAIWDPSIASWVPRYFMCGEYGDKHARPHYHAAVFGLLLPDLQVYSDAQGIKLYTSKILSDLWTHGFVTVGQVTYESASYVASYCTKKITGKNAAEHYTRTDPDTGEIYELAPEYARMSLKPAIAKPWIQKYTNDVYSYDHVVINGRSQKAPRYYDKHLELTNPQLLTTLKLSRQLKGKQTNSENHPSRLQQRKIYTQSKFKLKSRKL